MSLLYQFRLFRLTRKRRNSWPLERHWTKFFYERDAATSLVQWSAMASLQY
jgi:hypothetical protein